ncbi:LOW QUALITY PROTEIN: hypothetical protein V1477_002307 [Vespula maculifrons]|uniref:Uncharacterized protein n=1 Tax=Vespula maculifrons TaxID=7453 RepID=A0ABD2CW47_VESMC
MDSGANLTVGGFGPRGALFSFFHPVGVGAATGATPAVDYREPLNIASDGCATGTTGTAATATATATAAAAAAAAAVAVAAAAAATATGADYDESERFTENRQDFESLVGGCGRSEGGNALLTEKEEEEEEGEGEEEEEEESTLRFVSNQQRVGTSGSLKTTITIYRYRRPGHVTNACLPTHWLLYWDIANKIVSDIMAGVMAKEIHVLKTPLGAKDRRYPDPHQPYEDIIP